MRTKIIAIAAALLPALAVANGYDVPSVTPRDLALVGSGTAAQNDAGATFANPAALSKVRGSPQRCRLDPDLRPSGPRPAAP